MVLFHQKYEVNAISFSSLPASFSAWDKEKQQKVFIHRIEKNPFTEDYISFWQNQKKDFIVPILDTFVHDKEWFIVSKWFNGKPITHYSLKIEEWKIVFKKVLSAIHFFHENNYLHRGLKPQNILMDSEKNIQIDLSYSIFQPQKQKEEKYQSLLPYLSPEQTGLIKEEIDASSDIYSLGVIFYECLTGKNLFIAQEQSQILHNHLSIKPSRIGLTGYEGETLDKIILKMLAKEKKKRFSQIPTILKMLEKPRKITFPLEKKNNVLLRENLLNSFLNELPDFLKKNKGIIILSGKEGAGKSFFLEKAFTTTKEKMPCLKISATGTTPFAFLENLCQLLQIPFKKNKPVEIPFLPVLFIENIQRIDESSWNFLTQQENILIVATHNEDENFSFLNNYNALEQKVIFLPPYTEKEIATFILESFEHKIQLKETTLQRIYHISQGSLEIVQYILHYLYKNQALIYQDNIWQFQGEEKLIYSIQDKGLLEFRFAKLEKNLLSFINFCAIYAFPFSLENFKRIKHIIHLSLPEIKRCIKKAENEKIIEKTMNEEYCFTNENLRLYFYYKINPEERKKTHLLLAKTIEKLKEFDNRVFPLFHHYFYAEESLKAFTWGIRLIGELIPKYSYHQAIEVFEKIVILFEQFKEKNKEETFIFYETLQKIIPVYIFKGNYDYIIQILNKSVLYFDEKEDKEKLSMIYLSLGRFYTLKGEIKTGKKIYEKIIELIQEIKNPKLIKNIYESIALNYLFSSRFKETIWFFEKAEKFYDSSEYQESRMISFLGPMAYAYAHLGFYKKAEILLNQLWILIQKEQNPHLKFLGTHYYVLVSSHIGQIEHLSEKMLEDTLMHAKQEENKLLEYSFYFSLGYYYYRKKRMEKALSYLTHSVKLGEKIQAEIGILAPYLILCEILIRLKKYKPLFAFLKKIKPIIIKNSDDFCYQWYLRIKALLYSIFSRLPPKKIESMIKKAIQIAQRLKLKPEIAKNYFVYSQICFHLGWVEKGLSLEKKSLSLFDTLQMRYEKEEVENKIFSAQIQSQNQVLSDKLRIDTMTKITTLIQKQKNQQELFEEIMQMMILLSGATDAALWIMEEEKLQFVYSQNKKIKIEIDPLIVSRIQTTQKYYMGIEKNKGSFIYLPIWFQERLLGIIYLENQYLQNIFNEEQLKIIQILSTLFGVLIENAKTYKELENEKKNLEKKVEERTLEVYLRNQIIENDIFATRNFLRNLMPKKMPQIEGVCGNFIYDPVEEIGGDFYDFIVMEDNRFLFVIADAAGHGIRSSLLTAMLKTAIYTYPDKNYRIIKDLLCHINESLYGLIQDKYIVCSIGIIDAKKKTVTITSGGNIIAYYAEKDKKWQKIDTKGSLLGILPTKNLEFSTVVLKWEEGSKLFFTTDGLPEQFVRTPERKRIPFGENRLRQILESDLPPEEILPFLVRSVKDFIKTERFSDDITAILFWRP